MTVFVGYTHNGAIKNIMYCDEVGVTYEEDTGLAVLEADESVNMATHYIASGVVNKKQLFGFTVSVSQITANGTDEAIISNIPAGAQVEWPDRQTDIVNDGEIRFSVDLPGTYTFRLTAVPYLDQEVVIEAIAAA